MTELVGKKIGNIGYGMMGLTFPVNQNAKFDASASLQSALAHGCNFFNGGEFYGSPENNSLTLLNKYYAKYPKDAKKVVLSIKGGLRNFAPDGSPEYVRKSVENCLRMLGPVGKIDIFECARRDPKVPLETTLNTLAQLVNEGKIGGVGLSEVSAATIRQAAQVTKIVAVEIELSLWCTEPLTNGIAAACKELDIPIVAYSPVGRGFLTGQLKRPEDIPEDDMRRTFPQFQAENWDTNMKLVQELEKVATEKKCTPAQLAIGWLLTLSKRADMPTIVPIPGTRGVGRIEENAREVLLSEEEMKKIERILATGKVAGERYSTRGMEHVNG